MYNINIYKVTQEKVDTSEYRQVGKNDKGEPTYDYVHDYEEKEVSRNVLSQRVEELDLIAVVKAINGLN